MVSLTDRTRLALAVTQMVRQFCTKRSLKQRLLEAMNQLVGLGGRRRPRHQRLHQHRFNLDRGRIRPISCSCESCKLLSLAMLCLTYKNLNRLAPRIRFEEQQGAVES
jgi:hypothetical protein